MVNPLDPGDLLRVHGTGISWEALEELKQLMDRHGFDLALTDPHSIAMRVATTEGISHLFSRVQLREDVFAPKATAPQLGDAVSRLLGGDLPTDHIDFCDPYALKPRRPGEVAEHIEVVTRALSGPLAAARSMTVHFEHEGDGVREALSAALSERVKVSYMRNRAVHDRFVLLDGGRAGLIIGTSLNSLGRKYFLLDRLRDVDAQSLADALAESSTPA